MTKATTRRLGHLIVSHVEWLDKHTTVRRGKDAAKLEDTLRELEKMSLRLIGTSARSADLGVARRGVKQVLKGEDESRPNEGENG